MHTRNKTDLPAAEKRSSVTSAFLPSTSKKNIHLLVALMPMIETMQARLKRNALDDVEETSTKEVVSTLISMNYNEFRTGLLHG